MNNSGTIDLLKGKMIFVIDDSRSFAAGLRSLIENTGASCEVFTNPQEAFEIIETVIPDVFVTDLEMPNIDGYEVIKKIRSIERIKDTPILVLTGKEDGETMRRSIQIGADAFSVKSAVRETFIAHLLALTRLKEIYKMAIQGKQFEAIKALIGTYKHELGNALTIADGKLRRLTKNSPTLKEDEAYKGLEQALGRINDTLRKLDALRRYQEESYSGESKMLKAG
jgi:CheY-like chemotaxis protein